MPKKHDNAELAEILFLRIFCDLSGFCVERWVFHDASSTGGFRLRVCVIRPLVRLGVVTQGKSRMR
jgi:hypothetical protein